MKFGLDVPVEKRRLNNRGPVSFGLEFPPSARNAEGCRTWAARSGWDVASKRPGRVPGPVFITLQYEERAGRRISQDMIDPIIELLDKFSIIDAAHRAVIRQITAKWADVKGCLVTIEPAVERKAA